MLLYSCRTYIYDNKEFFPSIVLSEAMKNIIETLQERGFIEALTSAEIKEIVNKPIKVYAGFDPTADSLHLGNLVGIMALAWFQRFGHQPVAIVGGATGMIGDPSGKSVERNLLDAHTLTKNVAGIKTSLEAVLKQETVILNNFEWYKNVHFIDFLRDVGKHFRLGTMLGKEMVRTRLNSDEGLSFTEFSYQLLQAYDFLHLYDTHGVICQLGGSDQWGNITAGTELIRRLRGVTAHGITWPLLTRSDGKKFGKSEEGTIWLNADKLSHYEFYQYLVRVPDSDVIKLLKVLTFLDLKEIRDIEEEMKKSTYVANSAQKRFAAEVTRIVHGEEGLKMAEKLTQAMQPGSKMALDAQTFQALSEEAAHTELAEGDVIGKRLLDLLVATSLVGSKGEGRRLIANGGIYLNNEKITDEQMTLEFSHLVETHFLLLSVGKKKKLVVKVKKIS
jgi:tyrosyl-tRNA synthetase